MRTLLVFVLGSASAFAQDGAALYKTHCAACHDSPTEHVPPASAIRAMSATAILESLDSGTMKTQGAALTSDEKIALVRYLASSTLKVAVPLPASAFCAAKKQSSTTALESPRWMGWGADPANTRFASAEAAGIASANVPKLKLKWAFGLGDGTSVHSQVAVGGGRVFVANMTGQVYSLDADSGCIEWTFEAGKAVRSPIVLGAADRSGKQTALFFGET